MRSLVFHRRARGLQVHYASGDYCWASRGYSILCSEDAGLHWRHAAALPVPVGRRLLARHPLTSRLLRLGVHTLLPLDTRTMAAWVAVADGGLFRADTSSGVAELLCRIPRGRRPLRHGICAVGNAIYFGDYYSNPQREPVRVYRVDAQTGALAVLYEFAAGAARHVHVVQPDSTGSSLWIGTGDADSECGLYKYDLNSERLSCIGSGSQIWRAVSLAPREDGLYWGSDDHAGANAIWRLDGDEATPQCQGNVTGPVYYNTAVPNGLLFGTTMEKGEGEQDGYAHLYHLNGQGKPLEVWRLKKDLWNARYFGYGLFEFAGGNAQRGRFWVTTKGLQGGLVSYLASLEKAERDA